MMNEMMSSEEIILRLLGADVRLQRANHLHSRGFVAWGAANEIDKFFDALISRNLRVNCSCRLWTKNFNTGETEQQAHFTIDGINPDPA